MTLTVLAMVRTRHHSADWLEQFRKSVPAIKNEADFFRIAGDCDYMIKIVACAMIDFHRVQTRLIAGTNLEAATTDLPGNDPPAEAEADLFADL